MQEGDIPRVGFACLHSPDALLAVTDIGRFVVVLLVLYVCSCRLQGKLLLLYCIVLHCTALHCPLCPTLLLCLLLVAVLLCCCVAVCHWSLDSHQLAPISLPV